jgi:hypothetical protein
MERHTPVAATPTSNFLAILLISFLLSKIVNAITIFLNIRTLWGSQASAQALAHLAYQVMCQPRKKIPKNPKQLEFKRKKQLDLSSPR